jgi:hypothetical protein
MVAIYTSLILVIGLWAFGDFFSQVWAEIHEYETMKARGYKLFKDDEGKYWWVD